MACGFLMFPRRSVSPEVGTRLVQQRFLKMDLNTLIGSAAAVCTTLANFPQLKKCWTTGKAGDLSLKMFIILSVGLSLWAAYGFMQHDYVIIAANAVSLAMVLGILFYVLRDRFPRAFGHNAQDNRIARTGSCEGAVPVTQRLDRSVTTQPIPDAPLARRPVDNFDARLRI